MHVFLFHAFGKPPGSVDDEQAAISIGFAQDWSADAESNVTIERFRAVVGIGPENEFVASAQRFDRTFVSVLAAVDDDDRGWVSEQVVLSPLLRLVERGGYVDGDAAVAIEWVCRSFASGVE